ncbi:unnamed protein product [Protopolystoma xenopodis]|uniref:Uncharacterized protein n=1 Tax=Protopolystoma xenopodis TaxID=117903 RepID=A0A448X5T7_9PLAT|nr:unnamed protein product [Protopolystoma xenopodis]
MKRKHNSSHDTLIEPSKKLHTENGINCNDLQHSKEISFVDFVKNINHDSFEKQEVHSYVIEISDSSFSSPPYKSNSDESLLSPKSVKSRQIKINAYTVAKNDRKALPPQGPVSRSHFLEDAIALTLYENLNTEEFKFINDLKIMPNLLTTECDVCNTSGHLLFELERDEFFNHGVSLLE